MTGPAPTGGSGEGSGRRRAHRIVLGLAGAGLIAAAVTGCSGSSAVSKSDVEQQISSKLAAKVGQTPKSVSCPGNLKAKVGESMVCTLTADDGSTIGVTATVTSVSGGSVKFDIKAGTKATPAPAAS